MNLFYDFCLYCPCFFEIFISFWHFVFADDISFLPMLSKTSCWNTSTRLVSQVCLLFLGNYAERVLMNEKIQRNKYR